MSYFFLGKKVTKSQEKSMLSTRKKAEARPLIFRSLAPLLRYNNSGTFKVICSNQGFNLVREFSTLQLHFFRGMAMGNSDRDFKSTEAKLKEDSSEERRDSGLWSSLF